MAAWACARLHHSSATDTAAISSAWGTCNLIMAEQHAGRLAGRGAPEAAGKKAAAHLCIPSTAGLPCTLAVQETLLPSVLPERTGA